MNIEVNYAGLFIAGVISMIIGFVWYSPMFFGKPWMKLMGITKESMKAGQKEMGKLYGLSFILSLVTAFVLSHVITLSMHYFGTSKMSASFSTGFWMWLGFIMPVQVTSTIFGDRKWKLFGINTGYQLASIMAMALALSFV